MNIRYYIFQTKNAMLTRTRYRASNFVAILNVIISVSIQIFLWKALYDGNSVILTESNSLSFTDMIRYVVLSTVISIIVNNSIINDIGKRIQSGGISIDLIRPIGFFSQIIANQIIETIMSIMFKFVPLVLFCILIYGISVFEIENVVLFGFVLLNSMLLYYLINYCLGLLAFWFVNIWPVASILEGLVNLLSGALIPLWIVKNEVLLRIIELLPFRLIYYLPISVGINNSIGNLWELILLQYLWIMVFIIAAIYLWSTGIKKLTIQGG